MVLIGLVVAGVAVSAALALQAFRENVLFFFSPSEVIAGDAPVERGFRLGGMVADGSVAREEGSLTIDFVVTDYAHSIPVSYTGVLPDLFGEGQGVVVRGEMNENGSFTAQEVLAKHDENYMPPEVAEALERGRAATGSQ